MKNIEKPLHLRTSVIGSVRSDGAPPDGPPAAAGGGARVAGAGAGAGATPAGARGAPAGSAGGGGRAWHERGEREMIFLYTKHHQGGTTLYELGIP